MSQNAADAAVGSIPRLLIIAITMDGDWKIYISSSYMCTEQLTEAFDEKI